MLVLSESLFIATFLALTAADKVCLHLPYTNQKVNDVWINRIHMREPNYNNRVTCPNGDCMVFGDSRTDIAHNHLGSLDLPMDILPYMSPRTNSKSGASIYGTIARANTVLGPRDYQYGACTKSKIFYEGVNFSPSAGQICSGISVTAFSAFKHEFYKSLYAHAYQYKCFKLIKELQGTYNEQPISTSYPSCAPSNPIGFTWSTFGNRLTPEVANEDYFYTITNLDPTLVYIMPMCQFHFQTQQSVTELFGQTTVPITTMYNDKNQIVYRWSAADHWTMNSSRPYPLHCKFLPFSGSLSYKLVSQKGSGIHLPLRAYAFYEPLSDEDKIPVQVVQSGWSYNQLSDTWTQKLACEELGEQCIYIDVGTYVGLNDDNHGNPIVRNIFQNISRETVNFCDRQSFLYGCPTTCISKTMCDTVMHSNGVINVSPYKGMDTEVTKWMLSVNYPSIVTYETEMEQLSEELSVMNPEYITTNWKYEALKSKADIYASVLHDVQGSKWCADLPCRGKECLFTVQAVNTQSTSLTAWNALAIGLLVFLSVLMLIIIIWFIMKIVMYCKTSEDVQYNRVPLK